jgi:hypothetical protein
MAQPRKRNSIYDTVVAEDMADLKVGKHDEIMLWLDAHIEDIINNHVMPSTHRWSVQEINKALAYVQTQQKENQRSVEQELAYAQKNLERRRAQGAPNNDISDIEEEIEWHKKKERFLANFVMPTPSTANVSLKNVTWECPVKSDKFTVGFIDMRITLLVPCLGISDKFSFSREQGRAYVPKWDVYHENYYINFEVKSTIPSLGELIRQVRLYETYLNGKFYVVSPDTRFAEPLKKQGIGFIPYTENQS